MEYNFEMPKKKAPAKKKKVQRGGAVMMIRPHHYQIQTPYANVQDGEGFFGDLWDGIKSVAGKVGNVVKDSHLISSGLSMIPDARAKAAGGVAAQLGLGKKRKNVLKF